MGLPSLHVRFPRVMVTLLPSEAKSADVATLAFLFHAIEPCEPSNAISGSQRVAAIEPLLVLRCAAVPIGRIQLGVKFAGSA